MNLNPALRQLTFGAILMLLTGGLAGACGDDPQRKVPQSEGGAGQGDAGAARGGDAATTEAGAGGRLAKGGTGGDAGAGAVTDGGDAGAGGAGGAGGELIAACLAEQDVITFGAPELEAVIRDAIDKPSGELRVQDICRLTELRVEGLDTLTDLSGVEQLEQLRTLTIFPSAISDLTPVAALTGLRELTVASAQVSDISALAGLTELRLLNFNFNGADITDISVVANMPELVDLQLDGNALADLSPLAGLTKLTTLRLNDNPTIVDISPLSNLMLLADLDLSGTGIDDADLPNLAALTQLNSLGLSATSISSLGVISTLTLLTELTVDSTQIDAADLAELDTLVQLEASDNALTTLSTIPQPSSIEILNVGRNPLADHAELAAFTNVRRLFIDETGVVDGDLVHLQALTELDYLQLSRNGVTNLAPLLALGGLGDLVVTDNPLSAASCCTHIPALEQAGVSVYAGSACDAHACP